MVNKLTVGGTTYKIEEINHNQLDKLTLIGYSLNKQYNLQYTTRVNNWENEVRGELKFSDIEFGSTPKKLLIETESVPIAFVLEEIYLEETLETVYTK